MQTIHPQHRPLPNDEQVRAKLAEHKIHYQRNSPNLPPLDGLYKLIDHNIWQEQKAERDPHGELDRDLPLSLVPEVAVVKWEDWNQASENDALDIGVDVVQSVSVFKRNQKED